MTRVLERPFNADAVLSEILDKTIRLPTSIIKRIKFSEDLSDIFTQHVIEYTDSVVADASLSNLSSSLCRFDSLLRPLARVVLLLRPLCRTSFAIISLRVGQTESGDAARWLVFISQEEGMERLLLMGMMSDGGVVIAEVLRYFDTEGYDVAILVCMLACCARKLDYLFVQRQAHTVAPSYTSHMISQLKSPLSFFAAKKACQIGDHAGISAASISRCYDRMSSWVVLTIQTMKAECPNFETLQLFSVFNFNYREDERTIMSKLKRLAQKFNFSEAKLVAGYKRVLPLAEHARTHELDTFQTWRSASLDRTSDSDDIIDCIALLGAFCGCTTSGVEHVHSIQEWLWPKRRNHQSCHRENDEIKLVHDLEYLDVAEIIEFAQILWTVFFGKTRAHTKPRADKGTTRSAKTKKRKTLKNLTAAMGAALNAKVKALPFRSLEDIQRDAAASVNGNAAVWTDKHDQELEFQTLKRKECHLQSIASNAILSEDVTLADQDLSAKRIEHLTKLKNTRAKAAAKKKAALEGGNPFKLQLGTLVFVDATVQDSAAIQTIARQAGFQCTRIINEASVFVVRNVSSMPLRVEWTVCLNSGLVVDAVFFCKRFTSNQQGGSCIAYKSAIVRGKSGNGYRLFRFSPSFVRQHADLVGILRALAVSRQSAWREASTTAEFVVSVHRNAGSHLPAVQIRNLQQIMLFPEDSSAEVNLQIQSRLTPGSAS